MNREIESLFDLKGQTALIIGGAVNLGADMSSILAAAGCNVILTSRNNERATSQAAKLQEMFNCESLGLSLDHTKPEQVVATFSKAHSQAGKLDILVNNAGGGSGKGTALFPEREFSDISNLIDINLNGALFCCREASRIMKKQGSGKIINIASIAGILGRNRDMYSRNGMAGQAVEYAAAKAGIIGMTRDLAALLSPYNINVNTLSPGGFQRDLPKGFIQDYNARTPLGRMGKDGVDIKGPLLFLASPASNYVTGQNLVVDGGFTIWQ